MIHVKTMLGLGDAFAARPTIAALLRQDKIVLETPWPEIFEDIFRNRYCGPSESIFVRPLNLNIRCAKRNVEESKLFAEYGPGLLHDGRRIQLSYSLHKGCKSIPEQIAESAGVNPEWRDFFMPNANGGEMNCDAGHHHSRSPLAVFRLPTIRTEYHNVARNPAPGLVATAVDEIGGDWIHLNDTGRGLGEHYDDREYHPPKTEHVEAIYGQLSLLSMLDLVARARCVVTPTSWMAWAAAAYQVPTLAIWGGFCSPETILGPFASDLRAVLPTRPCWCFNPKHQCDKTTNIDTLRQRAREMVHAK